MKHIKGEDNGAAVKFSRIAWPEAVAKAGEIVNLAGAIEIDTHTADEYESNY